MYITDIVLVIFKNCFERRFQRVEDLKKVTILAKDCRHLLFSRVIGDIHH